MSSINNKLIVQILHYHSQGHKVDKRPKNNNGVKFIVKTYERLDCNIFIAQKYIISLSLKPH